MYKGRRARRLEALFGARPLFWVKNEVFDPIRGQSDSLTPTPLRLSDSADLYGFAASQTGKTTDARQVKGVAALSRLRRRRRPRTATATLRRVGIVMACAELREPIAKRRSDHRGRDSNPVQAEASSLHR